MSTKDQSAIFRLFGSLSLVAAAVFASVKASNKWRDVAPPEENEQKDNINITPQPAPWIFSITNSDPIEKIAAAGADESDLPEEPVCDVQTLIQYCIAKKDVELLPVLLNEGKLAPDREKRRRTRFAIIEGIVRQDYFPGRGGSLGFGCMKLGVLGRVHFTFEFFVHSTAKPVICLWIPFKNGEVTFEILNLLKTGIESYRTAHLRMPAEDSKLTCIAAVNSASLIDCVDAAFIQKKVARIDDLRANCWNGRGDFGIRLLFPRATAPLSYINQQLSQSVKDTMLYSLDKVARASTAEGVGVRFGDCFKVSYEDNKNPSIQFERLIVDDATTLRALVAELDNRKFLPQPDEKKQILLIGEADTKYGRSIMATAKDSIIEAALHSCGGDVGRNKSSIARNVISLNFLKGIAARDETSKTNKNDSADEPRNAGTSQEDYVRRAQRILREQQSVARGDGSVITAVGVFASDLYDKLIIIAAIHQVLPSAVIFTTDLDADYLSSNAYDRNRNLLIGSTYDLSLDKALMGPIPPFRDSLQTAAFLTSIHALDTKSADLDIHDTPLGMMPHIYEVSRQGAFDLTDFDNIQSTHLSLSALFSPEVKANDIITDVNPKSTPGFLGAFGRNTTAIVTALAIGALCIIVGSERARRVMHKLFQNRRDTSTRIVAAAAAGSLLLLLISAWVSREPVSFLGGISIWPTQGLRWLAIAVALVGLKWIINDLSLIIQKTDRGVFGTSRAPEPIQTPGRTLAITFENLTLKLQENTNAHKSGSGPPIALIWATFRKLLDPKEIIIKSIVPFVFIMMVSWILFLVFGVRPAPARDELSRLIDEVFGTAALLIVTFVALVVDRVLRVFGYMLSAANQWKRPASGQYADGQDGPYARVLLLAAMSAWITRFVNIPAFCVMLLLVARNSFFDSWSIAWPFAGVYVGVFILILFRCIRLWQIAQHLRSEIISELDPGIDSERKLRDRIADIQRGLFVDFTQIPIIKPVAIVAGAGGLAFTDLLGSFGSLLQGI